MCQALLLLLCEEKNSFVVCFYAGALRAFEYFFRFVFKSYALQCGKIWGESGKCAGTGRGRSLPRLSPPFILTGPMATGSH